MPESATYIAFLDSDDIWQPSHLSVALAVLDQGFDYYFCDCKRVEDTRTYLSYTPFTRLLQTAHPLAAPEGAYALDKQDFHDTSIEQWMSLIPTVVYRRAVAPGLTFDPLLRVAGEDALFLLQVMEKSDRSACSTQCLVSLADGINIYASTYNWDNPANFIRYMGEIAMFNECRKHLRFSARSDATARARIRGLRKLFAFHTLRYGLKIRKSWPADLKETVSRDQSFWWWYPLYVLYVAIAYPIRLYNPVKG